MDIPDNYEIILSLLYKSDPDPKKFSIRNKVLIRLYSDQRNMIFFSINGHDEGIRLTSRQRKEVIRLK